MTENATRGRILVGVDSSENAARALEWAASLATELGLHAVRAFEAEYGDPAKVLHAAAHDARLLVVGSHRRRRGPAPRLGSTVRELLAHPSTPVAVVPIR